MLQKQSNQERGGILFEQAINAAKATVSAETARRLDVLLGAYRNEVGVMPEEGIYSSRRMGTACIQAASCELESDTETIQLALDLYTENSPKTAATIRLSNDAEIKDRGKSIEGYAETGDAEHDKATRSIADYLENSIVKKPVEEFFVEDEDGDIRTLDAEVIDLIDDAAAEGQLSIEGMRALGLVNPNFDTTRDEVTSEIILSADHLVEHSADNWRHDEDGMLVILCPNCRKEAIYPLGEGMFGCFDCDTEFMFKLNLGDVL